jgi:hypothetical protein
MHFYCGPGAKSNLPPLWDIREAGLTSEKLKCVPVGASIVIMTPGPSTAQDQYGPKLKMSLAGTCLALRQSLKSEFQREGDPERGGCFRASLGAG